MKTGSDCRKMSYCDNEHVLMGKDVFRKKKKKKPMNWLKWPLLLLLCVLTKSIILLILKVIKIYLIPIEKNIDYESPNLDIVRFDFK